MLASADGGGELDQVANDFDTVANDAGNLASTDLAADFQDTLQEVQDKETDEVQGDTEKDPNSIEKDKATDSENVGESAAAEGAKLNPGSAEEDLKGNSDKEPKKSRLGKLREMGANLATNAKEQIASVLFGDLADDILALEEDNQNEQDKGSKQAGESGGDDEGISEKQKRGFFGRAKKD